MHSKKLLITLSLLAGLLYSSWPLGYVLNPKVAKSSLASGLEAVNQPFNWLFITTDIVSSLLLIIACALLWRGYQSSKMSKLIRLSLMGKGLFAVCTIIDALLPEHCVPNLMKCPNFTHDHYLLFHGIFSILASVFLFIALLIPWLYTRKSVVIETLFIGYIIFGLISLLEAVAPGNHGNWSENYYISLCSLCLICLPYTISLLNSQTYTSKINLPSFNKR